MTTVVVVLKFVRALSLSFLMGIVLTNLVSTSKRRFNARKPNEVAMGIYYDKTYTKAAFNHLSVQLTHFLPLQAST